MQKHRLALLWSLAVLLVVIIVLLAPTQPRNRANQPVYKGLNLAQWLDIAVRHRINGYYAKAPGRDATAEQIHEAEEAVRAIGTNAVPPLLAWISYEPSLPKRFYRGILGLLPLPEHMRAFLWGIPRTNSEQLGYLAVAGFRLLNTNALPAFADLSKLANDTNHPLTQIAAGKALVTITNQP